MIKRVTSLTLILSGVLCIALGISPGAVGSIAAAMPAAQEPSPLPERPPVDPPDRPTVAPLPTEESDESNDEGDDSDESDDEDDDDGGGGGSSRAEPTRVSLGRITGTVINQSTGAPAPNVEVVVGGVVVRTDANGNYERVGLLPGQYSVYLSISPQQGVPAQAQQTVGLRPAANEVRHLFFDPPAATSMPLVPTATARPLTDVQPPDTPGELPVTAGDTPDPVVEPPAAVAPSEVTRDSAQAAAAESAPVPSKLPVTAQTDAQPQTVGWLILGIVLALAGILLQWRPTLSRPLLVTAQGNGNTAQPDNEALLRKLLLSWKSDSSTLTKEQAEMLQALLERDIDR